MANYSLPPLSPRSLRAREIHESVENDRIVTIRFTPERHTALCQIADRVTHYGVGTDFPHTEFTGIDMLENRWTIRLETMISDCEDK